MVALECYYTLLQHPLSSKDNASASNCILAAASHATSSISPHPRFDIDTHEGERRCNFRSEDVTCLGLLHEVAPAVPSAERTRARTSCCPRRRDGKECRMCTYNGTKAFIRHLHKASYYIIHHKRFARKASYERSCFRRITTQAHPKSRRCSNSTPHIMGHGPGRPVKTRGRPHGHGGRRSSSSSTPHLMRSGPDRPVKTHGPPHGPGRAAHIEPTSHGPRPGPAHQNFREWAAARPSPSHFQIFTAGPGPAHQFF